MATWCAIFSKVAPAARRRAEDGFTLIEIIVVLVILGLMVGLVVSRGPLHSQRLDLDAAARAVAASLRLARSQAIAQDRTVVWAAGADRYRVDGGPPQRLPPDVSVQGASRIAFAEDGSSSGGLIALQGGQRKVAIEINWLTGHVQLAATP
jgi:general secretion pathway protein H